MIGGGFDVSLGVLFRGLVPSVAGRAGVLERDVRLTAHNHADARPASRLRIER